MKTLNQEIFISYPEITFSNSFKIVIIYFASEGNSLLPDYVLLEF